ncbi:hypothetical protein GLOTRDRAFT_71293 [Gloeophyllum trabeum ATCC 11539]|uniref:Ferritin-like domain-containing protein n=1 Tax=Gloeophyllum trabeum (strain ATCC 11539 / FP-39264 / Madison 617) TaxID=670483 RepID=S7QJX0_GLOTA|nr:uncharacterized protein GLOTRDRAFT_71293 [Gloeophyllum trabeum ATCC 11539]EPQ59667.1 hypothetical protein GLOTRDRAFT_71293 [Gloeophyllum trabeum ATCC 11539]
MYFSSSFSILALMAPVLVSAAPMRMSRRAASATDLLVLKFADVLEQLESQFYTQALSKFQESDFNAAGFSAAQVPIQQFSVIAGDEKTHSTVLQSQITDLGDKPITNCNFDFSSALTDVKTMAATARVVENVGVAAYLGAAHLVDDASLLTAAGSILTTEARHQTILNVLSGTGTAIPNAFDLAFTPSEVLAIASPFISGCDVGVAANPTLSVTNTGAVTTGTALTFKSDAIPSDTSKLSCQMLTGDMSFSVTLPFDSCVVPSGINGPVAVYITNDTQPLLANVVERATVNVVAGPTMAFIDTTPQMLGQLASATATASSGTTTSTITPEQASSIMASASAAQATASASVGGTAAAAAGVLDETPGSRNNFTGPSPDGHTFVNGYTN